MIGPAGVSLLAVAAFALALRWCRVASAGERLVGSVLAGLTSMFDGGLDDRAKEVAVRRAGLDLIAASLGILWRFGLALAAGAIPIVVADRSGFASADAIVGLLLRPDVVLLVSIGSLLFASGYRRWRRARGAGGDASYSMADRFLHGLAFAGPGVLKAAARLEDRLVPASADEPPGPPIFITSLARGGTTALLNALADLPGVATHTYRDMPFVTAPTLWNKVAGGKRRRVERRERAHGDGLEIDLDSPEALEEVVWKLWWPDKYVGAAITPWRETDRRPDADEFLGRHMARIVHARRAQADDGSVTVARYVSKNNANIARIPYLVDAFPGCRIVVPIRRPECHAASLLRQHRNFLARQADDEFVRRYMEDIGHHEFGLTYKPIAFPGFDPDRHDPASGDHWLAYWIAVFREVLRHGDRCLFVTQDDLRAAPQRTMTDLCAALGLPAAGQRSDTYFRSGLDEAPTDLYDADLLAEATALYRELDALAMGRSGRSNGGGARPSAAASQVGVDAP